MLVSLSPLPPPFLEVWVDLAEEGGPQPASWMALEQQLQLFWLGHPTDT